MPFIELPVLSDEAESAVAQLINVNCIGRLYPNPQSNRKCIIELSYQSVNDAPVFLEIHSPYETVKATLSTF